MISLYRDEAEILMVLINASEPVSGVVLCEKTSFGIKTLKSEIKTLNLLCQENGCSIKSVTGSGYLLEITDEDLFVPFRTYLENKYYNNMLYTDARAERLHFIMRKILASGKVYIQNLALECLCSESTISRDMKEVKQRLSEYGLTVANHTNHGIILRGSEWNIRLAIVNEFNLYQTFVRVEYRDSETDFEKLLLADGSYNQIMKERVSLLLSQIGYHLPHTTGYKLANLMILTITRRKNSDGLLERKNDFMRLECEYEKEIIQRVFDNLPSLAAIQLSEIECLSLAAYLKSNRVYKYGEFLQEVNEADRSKVISTVDGFMEHIRGLVDISTADTDVLHKDLCCELTRFMYRSWLDVKTGVSFADSFRRDGLITYDFCIMLYRYLRDNTDIRLTIDDCLQFYFIFSEYISRSSVNDRKKVLIVIRSGFYTSRGLATRIGNNAVLRNIELIPMEHTRINEINMSEIDGIITDISEIRNRYNYKNIYDIQSFRRADETERFMNQIRIPLNYFRDELLSVNDVYYDSSIQDEDDFIRLLREDILAGYPRKEEFISALLKKDAIADAARINNYAVYNLVHDFLGEDFIKIIFVRNEMTIGANRINKIILFNAKGSNLAHLSYVSEVVAKLLHATDLIPSYDLEKDYKLIENIVYR